MRGSPPLALATPLKGVPINTLGLGLTLTRSNGLPVGCVGTSGRSGRTRGGEPVATRLGAITFVVPNLTTAMALSIGSGISGWLVLLKSVGLGKMSMFKREEGGPLLSGVILAGSHSLLATYIS